MVAVRHSIETYDPSMHRRRFVDTPPTTTSGSGGSVGLIVDFGIARGRSRADLELVIGNEPENTAVALRSMPLSEEAAVAMQRMLEDNTTPTHAGEALPTVSAQELLRRLGR